MTNQNVLQPPCYTSTPETSPDASDFIHHICAAFETKSISSLVFFILGGVTNTGDDKWPPLDNYQAPYREPILAPTTNSLTNSNGIISILPAPAKFNMQTNRLPRNIFYPSVLMNPSKPAQVSFSLD